MRKCRWGLVLVLSIICVGTFQNCSNKFESANGYGRLQNDPQQNLDSDDPAKPPASDLPMEDVGLTLDQSALQYELKSETFDGLLSWVGINNEFNSERPCNEKQNNLSILNSNNAGGGVGELGGRSYRSIRQTYYAYAFPRQVNLMNGFSAKGKLRLKTPHSPHIGWFNKSTSTHWRPRNMLGFRFEPVRGKPGYVKAVVDYTTYQNRSGSTYEKYGRPTDIVLTQDSGVINWAIEFSPSNGGSITIKINGQYDHLKFDERHLADNAEFTHFGVFTPTSWGSGDEYEFYLDDILLNSGARFAFDSSDRDPFEGRYINERVPVCDFVREDYGIRRYQNLNGLSLGGWVRRYDIASIGGMVQYYDNLAHRLRLLSGLYMDGKLAVPVGQSDSDVLVGWYLGSSYDNTTTTFPPSFVGFHIGGNSRDGILLEPLIISDGQPRTSYSPEVLYRIIPGQTVMNFRIAFKPDQKAIEVNVNNKAFGPYKLDQVPDVDVDRFGLLPIRSGGGPMELYLDDLRYSYR